MTWIALRFSNDAFVRFCFSRSQTGVSLRGIGSCVFGSVIKSDISLLLLKRSMLAGTVSQIKTEKAMEKHFRDELFSGSISVLSK